MVTTAKTVCMVASVRIHNTSKFQRTQKHKRNMNILCDSLTSVADIIGIFTMDIYMTWRKIMEIYERKKSLFS